MKSQDYLYEVIKAAPKGRDGYMIHGKRYGIGTAKINGVWKETVVQYRYYSCHVVSRSFDNAEDAWEDFLRLKYPDVLNKWKDMEDNSCYLNKN